MRAVRLIFSTLLFITSFLFFMIFVIGLFDSSFESGWIGLILSAITFTAGYFIKGKSKRQIEKKENEKELRERGIITSSSLHHVEGLPIAEKTVCTLHVTNDSLIIEGGGSSFELKSSQIRAAEVKTDAEIANIVHSSAVKGIAGGLLFGPIGLVVGARATNKKQTTYTHYLIVNFENSEGALTALMFDGGSSPFSAQKISNSLIPILKDNPKKVVQL